jgi:hypothetical protein
MLKTMARKTVEKESLFIEFPSRLRRGQRHIKSKGAQSHQGIFRKVKKMESESCL